jgi:hypothetical protein
MTVTDLIRYGDRSPAATVMPVLDHIGLLL